MGEGGGDGENHAERRGEGGAGEREERTGEVREPAEEVAQVRQVTVVARPSGSTEDG
jgi:hypothetical protein